MGTPVLSQDRLYFKDLRSVERSLNQPGTENAALFGMIIREGTKFGHYVHLKEINIRDGYITYQDPKTANRISKVAVDFRSTEVSRGSSLDNIGHASPNQPLKLRMLHKFVLDMNGRAPREVNRKDSRREARQTRAPKKRQTPPQREYLIDKYELRDLAFDLQADGKIAQFVELVAAPQFVDGYLKLSNGNFISVYNYVHDLANFLENYHPKKREKKYYRQLRSLERGYRQSLQ